NRIERRGGRSEQAELPLGTARGSRSGEGLGGGDFHSQARIAAALALARRAKVLTDYQDAAYARGYTDCVARVRTAEAAKVPGASALTEAVARYYFKLLAVK